MKVPKRAALTCAVHLPRQTRSSLSGALQCGGLDSHGSAELQAWMSKKFSTMSPLKLPTIGRRHCLVRLMPVARDQAKFSRKSLTRIELVKSSTAHQYLFSLFLLSSFLLVP